jgi:hypothetical protein
LRPTEIRLLRDSQISETGILFRPTKTNDASGAEVTWPFTPEIQAVLERACKLNKLSALHSRLFMLQSSDGSAYTKTGLKSLWRRARAKAQVAGVTTRDNIRPFALTTAEQMRYNVDQLRKAAGVTPRSRPPRAIWGSIGRSSATCV